MQVYFLQMTKINKTTQRSKDPTAIKIGKRIAQARKMAGFSTAREFRQQLGDWPQNRLSWLEAGYSMPHPDDVQLMARVTGASPCWIMFGLGPIRSAERDLQAVRHQNLVYLQRQWNQHPDELLSALELSAEQFAQHLENPFKRVSDRLARRLEKATGRAARWLDEQHIESDGLCASFPDDLRELMTIYSEMDRSGRKLLIAMAATLAAHRPP